MLMIVPKSSLNPVSLLGSRDVCNLYLSYLILIVVVVCMSEGYFCVGSVHETVHVWICEGQRQHLGVSPPRLSAMDSGDQT